MSLGVTTYGSNDLTGGDCSSAPPVSNKEILRNTPCGHAYPNDYPNMMLALALGEGNTPLPARQKCITSQRRGSKNSKCPPTIMIMDVGMKIS